MWIAIFIVYAAGVLLTARSLLSSTTSGMGYALIALWPAYWSWHVVSAIRDRNKPVEPPRRRRR